MRVAHGKTRAVGSLPAGVRPCRAEHDCAPVLQPMLVDDRPRVAGRRTPATTFTPVVTTAVPWPGGVAGRGAPRRVPARAAVPPAWFATGRNATRAAVVGVAASGDVLKLLLCTDLLLIALHLAHTFTPYFSGAEFSLVMERGFGEAAQYAKGLWIVFGFLGVAWRTGERAYATWSVVFGYLVVDDLFTVHEDVGRGLAASLHLPSAFGLRAEDFGELLVFAAIGTATAALVAAAYAAGSATFRRRALHVAVLLVAFAGFAGFADMLHIAVSGFAPLGHAFDVVEDGGEMLVMSVICGYVVATLASEAPARSS